MEQPVRYVPACSAVLFTQTDRVVATIMFAIVFIRDHTSTAMGVTL